MPSNMWDSKGIEVVRFEGCQDYNRIWDLQKTLNGEVALGKHHETILLLEHEPVYTLGFHGNVDNLLLPVERLEELGAGLVRIERGGEITFHGPGQLVAYIIIDLRRRPYGVKRLVEKIENAVALTCRELGIDTFVNPDAPGLWCATDAGVKKICAIGLKVKNGVIMHGLALNVATDLSWFDHINPCGFSPGSVTSVERMLGGRSVPGLNDVADILQRHLVAELEIDQP